jgi:cyanophycinase
MVIGGAEDKFRDKAILSRFVKFAGGQDGHVVVISTASSLGDQATEMYRELFLGLGIGTVTGLRPEEREEADDPSSASALQGHRRVPDRWNQSRLASVVAGTRLGDALFLAHDRGPCWRARLRGRARWRRTWWRSEWARPRRTAWRSSPPDSASCKDW